MSAPVDSTGLIGRTVHQTPGDAGTLITAANLNDWIRPIIPPAGVHKNDQDAAVFDWTTALSDPTLVLGEPDDPTRFADSANISATSPNLLAVDLQYSQSLVEGRPRVLFDPATGRLAHPTLRTHVGKRLLSVSLLAVTAVLMRLAPPR